jgi:chloramphenicol-sensitive protein RarD
MTVVTSRREDSERRAGVVYGFSAYLIWGLFPLFFPLLEPAGPVEILAHRIVWSLIAVAIVVAVASGSLKSIGAVLRDRRRALLLTAAAVLIGVNWGVSSTPSTPIT